MSSKQYTESERRIATAQKRQEARQQVEAATRQLLTSEGWQAWVRTRASFHEYSFGNTLMIFSQRPDATQVAGYRRWQELGRHVKRGEHGIKIYAPMIVGGDKDSRRELRQAGETMQATSGEKMPDDSARVVFRVVSVFDIGQTDGEDLPEPPSEPITGDSHEHLIPSLMDKARELGFSVATEALEQAGGYCDLRERRIVVNSELGSANARVHVLVHELAHAIGNVDYKQYSRADAECIVECAAVIACGALGLDTSGESIPYLASWGEASDLAAIQANAEAVDKIASAIEAVQS